MDNLYERGLFMLRIEEELKTNELSRIQLIYGEETYLVRYYKNKLIAKLSNPNDEMNVTMFTNRTISTSDVAEAGQVMPFFAERRLLVVENSLFFKNKCDMLDYLKEFPDTTYVIFIEKKVDHRNRLYRWINKNGCVTECRHLPAPKLKQWIAGYAKKAGKTITVSAVEMLLERTGTDMQLLSNEMEKCIGYVGKEVAIDKEDVNVISTGVVMSKIFDMIDAVAMKKKEQALRYYNDLYINRESPMSILHLFCRHVNILLQMKEYSSMGLTQGELAKKCEIPPFTVDKYEKQSRLFKKNQLLAMLELRLQYEYNYKVGKMDERLAVELFLMRILERLSSFV